ncbi:MAG: hypothetical protein Tsb002_34440 [Wenzhouxiangellaceae bacterium]
MRYLPKLFLLASLMLAAAVLLADHNQASGASAPPLALSASPGPGADFEFVPSEEIGADSGVAFPADI